MTERQDLVKRALKRMLANGRLTAVPKRPSDQDILLAVALTRFSAERTYTESEVNDILESWLGTISEPFGIDRVTLRRMLVDSRLLARTKSGSTYAIAQGKASTVQELRQVDPAAIVLEISNERDLRKRQRAA